MRSSPSACFSPSVIRGVPSSHSKARRPSRRNGLSRTRLLGHDSVDDVAAGNERIRLLEKWMLSRNAPGLVIGHDLESGRYWGTPPFSPLEIMRPPDDRSYRGPRGA